MKLAEALLLRGDMQTKIESLRGRIVSNVLFQEGSKPHEDPNELLDEAASTIQEMEKLIISINSANLANRLSDGRTLTEALARRESQVQRHSLMRAALSAAGKEPNRYSMREIKWLSAINVAELQRQSEDLARQIRELNALIQEKNWTIEL